MNRMNVTKARAAAKGIYVFKAKDFRKGWDIVDEVGPRGLALTKREAVNLAYHSSSTAVKSRIYVCDVDNNWHRWNCEKVAHPSVTPSPCNCHRLLF